MPNSITWRGRELHGWQRAAAIIAMIFALLVLSPVVAWAILAETWRDAQAHGASGEEATNDR